MNPSHINQRALKMKIVSISDQMDSRERGFDVKLFVSPAKSCPKEVKEAFKYHETLTKTEVRTENPCCGKHLIQSSCLCVFRRRMSFSLESYIPTFPEDQRKKKQDSHSDAIGYSRTEVSFALLRRSVLCLEGSIYSPSS